MGARRIPPRGIAWREQVEDVLAAVLEKDELIVIQLYCENAECAVREIKIRCKDYDKTLIPLGVGKPCCPMCGTDDVIVCGVATYAGEERARNTDARERVNLQMWLRDNRTEGDRLECYPASRAMDDRLPPTPDGWWDEGLISPSPEASPPA